ncbi:MAG TPA: DUF547 domain-containing protein [Vicinamibacterales bacterium]|nr:DUF547 domain-containing protein [Vicinamibacterales bacterium]
MKVFVTGVLLIASALSMAAFPVSGAKAAQQSSPTPADVDALHRPYDEILDLYVRDGLVYYFALKQERAKFDRYVQALGEVTPDTLKGWSPDRQLAYWINAYNAFVLRTVIDSYPIRGRSADYPANSIRQIPGAFERRQFRAAGRMLTLDAIEKDVIGEFNDPRALLALGRGAVGSPRLKSEAYTAPRLDSQLQTMTSELVTNRDLVFVDIANERLSVNPVFSWREPIFSRTLADRAPAVYAARSPIERSVLALIDPVLVPNESEFLRKNTFRMAFSDFDWKLNDLTGR